MPIDVGLPPQLTPYTIIGPRPPYQTVGLDGSDEGTRDLVNVVRAKTEIVARTRTNTVAGAPNFGNPGIVFAHNASPLPRALYQDHLYVALRQYLPDSDFQVLVSRRLITEQSWQQVAISYEGPTN